jgi:hypothetical protein
MSPEPKEDLLMRLRMFLAPLALSALPHAGGADTLFASDPAGMAAAVSALGFRAALERDEYDDPIIRSAAEGLNFSIIFYGCTDGADCGSIQFSAWFDLDARATAAAMNAWNRKVRFGQTFIDDEGDPHLQLDIEMAGGLPRANFDALFVRWQSLLGTFKDHIDW